VSVSLDDLGARIAALTTLVTKLLESSEVSQQAQTNLGLMWQEKSIYDSLIFQDKTPDEAIEYIRRMKNGEKPWLDNPLGS
jgi:hypothetical protein